MVKTGHFQWEKRKLTVLSEADVALVEAMLMGLAQPHRQTLLDLTLMGSLPLSAEQSLRKLLSEWRARLHLCGFTTMRFCPKSRKMSWTTCRQKVFAKRRR